MSSNDAFDRIARAWLSEGPTELSDRVVEAALKDVHLIQSQRAWRPRWRFLSMSLNFGRGLVVAATLVAIAAGAVLFAQWTPNGVGGPTSSSTAAPPSPSPCVVAVAVGSPLSRGTCTLVTSRFRPAFTMIGDANWTPIYEGPRGFELSSGVINNHEGLVIATVDQVAAKPCQANEATAPDTSTVVFHPATASTAPADFLAWIMANTPLVLPAPTSVSIGGHTGLRVSGTVSGGSLARCGGYVVLTYAGAVSPAVDPGTPVRIAEGTNDFIVLEVSGTLVFIAPFSPRQTEVRFRPVVDQFLAGVHFQ